MARGRLRFLGRPALQMDRKGLSHAVAGEVRWPEVVGISLQSREVKGQEFHVLVVGVASRDAIHQSGIARWLAPSKKGLEINLKGLDQPRPGSTPRQWRCGTGWNRRGNPSWFPGISPEQMQVLRMQHELLDRLQREATPPAHPTVDDANRALAALEEFQAEMERLRPGIEAQARQQRQKLRLMTWGLAGLMLLGVAAAIAWLVHRA
jgi:hypothetical protein